LVVSTPPEPDFLARLGEIPDPASARASADPPRLPQLDPDVPTRAVAHRRRLAALVGGLSWLGVHLAVFGVRTDLKQLPPVYVLAQMVLPVVLAVVSLFVAMGSGALGVGGRVVLISTLAVLGPGTFCLMALGAPAPESGGAGAGSFEDAVLCFDLTVAWVAVPFVAAVVALRSAFVTGARWRSALLGGGIGLFAGATMNLHCPNVAPLHMLVGHGLAVVLAAALGGLLLSRKTSA
jgi:Negative regulator of sigma F